MMTYFKRMQDETDYIIVKSGFSADMNDVYLVITPKAESEQQFPKELERAFPEDKRFILDENISELRDFIFDFIRDQQMAFKKKSIDQWEKRKRNGRRIFALLYTALECVTKNQSVSIRVLVQPSIVNMLL